jgi:hypothetical protein
MVAFACGFIVSLSGICVVDAVCAERDLVAHFYILSQAMSGMCVDELGGLLV